LRRKPVSTVSLFGKESKGFLQKTGTKRPTWHGGDILGNECRKLMALVRLIFDQIKASLVKQLMEDGGSGPRTPSVALPMIFKEWHELCQKKDKIAVVYSR
jgi:hypothetical protein